MAEISLQLRWVTLVYGPLMRLQPRREPVFIWRFDCRPLVTITLSEGTTSAWVTLTRTGSPSEAGRKGQPSTSSSPLQSPSSPSLAEPNRQRTLAEYSPWVHRRVRHSLATKQQQSQMWFSEMLLQDHRADYWSQWFHAKGQNSSREGSSWGHVALRLSESFANSEP